MPRDNATMPAHVPPELLTAEAEHALLGALLLRNELFDRVSNIVEPGHFSYPVHGRIFAAIGDLVMAGTPANPMTLRRLADTDPALVDNGGFDYLRRLATDGVVSFLNTPYYAEQIADAAYRRALVDVLNDTLEDTLRQGPEQAFDRSFIEVVDQHERKLSALHDDSAEERPIISMGDAVDAALQAAEEVWKADGRITGITTGLVDLDRALGGLHRTDLIVLAGRPGMGKSAMATTIGEASARDGKPVFLASLEMSADQIAARQIAANCGISAERQRIGPLSRDEINRLVEAGNALRALPLHFDDMVLNSVEKLRGRLRRHKRRHGLGLVIVDYLQLLIGERAENRVQEVSATTRGLKAIAKDFEVPVVALSQLSRAVEQRDDKRPMLSDLRESGSIEQDADVVMFLYRDEYYAADEAPRQGERERDEVFSARVSQHEDRLARVHNLADILIRKNRHGRTRTVTVRFDAERTAFSNLARGEP